MTLADTLAAIAALPDDAKITVSIEKADFVRALERRGAGGADVVDTLTAASTLGYTADRWRRWCAAGRIAGAWQDAKGGSWRMPRASCTAHLAQLRQQGARQVARQAVRRPALITPSFRERRSRGSSSPSKGTSTANSSSSSTERAPRGPRLHGDHTGGVRAEAAAPAQAG
jgi:D-alanyl-D-alanine carboxypeptidase